MRSDLTELVMILDMSGSMHSLRDDTIGGYNTLIDEQKKEEGDACVTTVLFNSDYVMIHDRTDIKDVKKIKKKDYIPSGMTAATTMPKCQPATAATAHGRTIRP